MVPEAWLPVMAKLVGKESLCASRSELVRKAIGRKLKEEISIAKANKPLDDPKELERVEHEKLNKIVKESVKKTRNNSKLLNL